MNRENSPPDYRAIARENREKLAAQRDYVLGRFKESRLTLTMPEGAPPLLDAEQPSDGEVKTLVEELKATRNAAPLATAQAHARELGLVAEAVCGEGFGDFVFDPDDTFGSEGLDDPNQLPAGLVMNFSERSQPDRTDPFYYGQPGPRRGA